MGAQANLFGYSIPVNERGCLLSYLPLAHIYEVRLLIILLEPGNSYIIAYSGIMSFALSPLVVASVSSLVTLSACSKMPRSSNRTTSPPYPES